MLFDLEKHFAPFAAREMASQSLEDRQRDVYDSHRHRVFSVSFYMTGSEIEAEQILEGTFIRAFSGVREPDHKVVDHALVEELKDRLPIQRDEAIPLPNGTFLSLGRNVLRTELEEGIRCLPAQERLIFLLMDVEGYPATRVAELLQLQESEVFRTIVRARIRLRAELAAQRAEDERAA
jgi:DNA-directed RNA polymerase specialized sigma24 family protein